MATKNNFGATLSIYDKDGYYRMLLKDLAELFQDDLHPDEQGAVELVRRLIKYGSWTLQNHPEMVARRELAAEI